MGHLAMFSMLSMILKSDYNHGFKNLKIYNICPQNAFIKFHKRDKK